MDKFVRWRTSSYTGKNDHCVEIGATADLAEVGIRDTKDRRGPRITVSAELFRNFISGLINSDGWRGAS